VVLGRANSELDKIILNIRLGPVDIEDSPG
jgi:hypothetical protein